jgi:hypothetical protein
MSGAKSETVKIGFVQIFVALIMTLGFGYLFQFHLIPAGSADFVVPLFEPEQDMRDKIGFVHFEGDGLVWASTSIENEEKIEGTNPTIAKEYINGEYVFDFTLDPKNKAEHGYSKTDSEYYVKAPALGENAIFIEPYKAFTIISLVIGFVIMIIITILMPSSLGLFAALFEEQVHHVKTKIRLQSGFSDEIVEVLTLPDGDLGNVDRDRLESSFRVVWNKTVSETEKTADHRIMFDDVWDEDTDVVFFRNVALYQRIKEYFSEFVETEIVNCKDGRLWSKRRFMIGKGLRLYMAHHFSHKYANNVTGAAYGGAAVLIIAVGIRGLKFIPAVRPSFILGAIFLEFMLLSLMAVTLFYTEEEERMDKMLKRMEDANRSQLDALKTQQEDIHKMSNALVGQNSEAIKAKIESTISEYLTSGEQVNKQIAEAIASKLVFDISSKK